MSELHTSLSKLQAELPEGERLYLHREFPRYAVTDHGRIYSSIVNRFLRPIQMGNYLGVQLVDGLARRRHRYIHRLVLEAVSGPCPEGMEARHLNGDRYDNRARNLAWGTRQENAEDQLRHGTRLYGDRNPMAKLTSAQVAEIRMMVQAGSSQRAAVKRFGVSPMTVSRIVRGEAWVGGAA